MLLKLGKQNPQLGPRLSLFLVSMASQFVVKVMQRRDEEKKERKKKNTNSLFSGARQAKNMVSTRTHT